ncbi:MAG: Male sterility domain protein [Nitrospirae bacterium]|nr:MAG: Male sterility domain protein [Nitrospirota bacterium]
MKILLTGSTGFIGHRLLLRLLEEPAVPIRLLVRNARKVSDGLRERVEVFEGDVFDPLSLDRALSGVDVAYYLVHSMTAKDFRERDRLSAANFRDACIGAGVKRIVYFGGLGVKETASEHLLSRIEVGEILCSMPEQVQTIWFRAGVVIGSGSASFEIMRHLVQKLPVMTTPKWVRTKTQPIAVDDAISYLSAAKDLKAEGNLVVDVGTDALSFGDMMLQTAEVMGLKRYLIPVPVLTPRLSSYWLILMTPIPFNIAAELIEGLKSETVMQNDNAHRYFPAIRPMTLKEAVRRAVDEIIQQQVVSRWCDSSAGEVCDINYHENSLNDAVYKFRKVKTFPPEMAASVFKAVLTVGGEGGWFRYNLLWKIRGVIDKLIGGYGLNRGRRHGTDLRVGDSLDWWKVVDMRDGKRLLLQSQMKQPCCAWLEFLVEHDTLTITAYFYPRGLGGRIYWYATLPAHYLVFEDLASSILKKAETL